MRTGYPPFGFSTSSFGAVAPLFGVDIRVDRHLPDGQVVKMGNTILIGVNEPHAIAKRIVREGLADVLAWLTPERRPNMTTGQEILDRLRAT